MSSDEIKAKYPAGDSRPVLITEVTRMSNGVYCVAGFDVHSGKMIRPLQPPASNWRLTSRDVFAPGNLVAFKYTGARGNGAYPHRTEDTVVAATPNVLEALRPEDVYDTLRESLFPSIAELYDNQLIENKYVNDGMRCRSLGGVMVSPEQLQFDEYFGKLRLRIRDNDGTNYSLSVTSDELRTAFHNDPREQPNVIGADAWLASIPRDRQPVLRLGLARAWDGKEQKYDPKRCFLQLNGLIVV